MKETEYLMEEIENQDLVLREVKTILGESASVVNYIDKNETSNIQLVSQTDLPILNVTTSTTLTLHKTSLLEPNPDLDLRVEFIAGYLTRNEQFATVITTAGFCVTNSKWRVFPGQLFPHVVGAFFSDTSVPHLLLTTPFSLGACTAQNFRE